MNGSGYIGGMVPPGFDGTVASIHPRRAGQVTNVLVQDGLGPYFVSLISDREDLTAGAIMVSTRVSPGEPVVRRGETLFLPDRQVSLQHLEVWDGRPRLTSREASRIIAPELVTALYRTLEERTVFHRGMALLLHPCPGDPALREPWLERSRRIVSAGVNTLPVDLIGLGPGFTPAGDDFLTGVLLAHRLTATAKGGGAGVDADTAGITAPEVDVVRARLRTTTAGGATILRHALSGSFPFYLIKICGILTDPDTDQSEKTHRACRIAAEHGHSSGIDSLTGLLWCLSGGDTSVFPTTLDDGKRGQL